MYITGNTAFSGNLASDDGGGVSALSSGVYISGNMATQVDMVEESVHSTVMLSSLETTLPLLSTGQFLEVAVDMHSSVT